MKAALAIGGTAALSTSMGLYGLSGTAGARKTFAERDNRQHAWNDYLTETDSRGLPVPPRHRLLLLMDYEGRGRPTVSDRKEVEGALRQLEAAFEWSSDGLLFTIGYAPQYFDRFNPNLPSGIDLTGLGNADLQALIDAIAVDGEDPTPEPREVHMHLASHNATNLLAAEDALFGNLGTLNGVTIDATFEGIFTEPETFPDRRTGFVGGGEPAEHVNNSNIPQEAPLSMGFQSGFTDNLPHEDLVSFVHDQTFGQPMPPGIFAQGSAEQVSKLDIDLQSWYDMPKEDRTARMYSPHHVGEVGNVGNALGTTSNLAHIDVLDLSDSTDIARETEQDAKNGGVVGHQQKLARSRFDLDARRASSSGDDVQDTTILRRDFDTTNTGGPGLHFVALTRFMTYMDYVRNSMNSVTFQHPFSTGQEIDHTDPGIAKEDDGFLDFITATRRGVFLVPPLWVRSLPRPRGLVPFMDLRNIDDVLDLSEHDFVEVVLTADSTGSEDSTVKPANIAPKSLRFGPPTEVHQARGAPPEKVDQTSERLVAVFPVERARFQPGDTLARLRGRTEETGRPILAEAQLKVVE